MPSDTELLATIKSSLLAQIADLTANPKPNYSIDGQSVSWQSLYDSLWDKLQAVDAQIAAASPFEITSQGYT